MGKILVIVDVQKEFDEYIQHDLVDALSNYAEKFDTVYQIWDTHNNTVAPTHSFPGQVDSVPKKYGKKHFSDDVKKFIEKIKNSSEEGRTFKLDNDEGYIVRVKNNHDWFYVNPEIVELISKLKGNKVILAGGADGECLEDVYQTFLSFGLKIHINKKYTYDAKTSDEDSVEDVMEVIETKKIPAFTSKELILENDNLTNYEFDKLIFKIDNEGDVTKIVNYVQNLFPDKEISSSAFEPDFRDNMTYPNWLFLDLYVLCDTRDYNHEVSLNILANTPNENSLNIFITKQLDKGLDKKYDTNVITVDRLGEFEALVKTGIRRFTPKPTYMLSREERNKRFVKEAKNDKDTSREIAIRLDNIKEQQQLYSIIIEIDRGFNIDFANEFPCVVYLDYKRQAACWGQPGSRDCDASFNGEFEDEWLDGVYEKLYNISDIRTIEKILREKQIVDDRPSYMLSKEDRKKRFLYENKNSIDDAFEIVIKIETNEQYQTLRSELGKIDEIYLENMSFETDYAPYYFFIFFNLDNKSEAPHDLVSHFHGGDSESRYLINNDVVGSSWLNGAYERIFTFNELDEVLRIVKNKTITNTTPRYMMSSKDRKERFIR